MRETNVEENSRWARWPWAPVAVGAVAMVALVARLGGYVPIWDGRIYADCVIDAALAPPWELSRLACAGHPTHAWAILHAFAQRLSPGSTWLLLLVDLALAVVALRAFHSLASRVFDHPMHRAAVGMLTVALAVDPTVLGSTLQPNPDVGVYAFFLAALAAMTNGRWLAATLWGVALALSKETGAMLWAVIFAVEVVAITRSERAREEKLRALRERVPMVLPFLAVGAWIATRSLTSRAVLWTPVAGATSHALHDLLSFSLDDKVFHAYLAVTAVMNFAWVASIAVVFDLSRRAWAWAFRAPLAPVAGVDPRRLSNLLTVTVLSALVLTRYRTFANPRYFLPLHPLLLLTAYAALSRPPVWATVRRVVPALLVVLFTVSCVRTVDPVSRALFGTFSVGSTRLLYMTRIGRECCGFGRDQLVYNLQFARFDSLLQQALADLRPDSRHRVGWSRPADWFINGALDRQSYQRTLRRGSSTVTFTPVEAESLLLAGMPNGADSVTLLRLAYAPHDAVVELLRERFTVTQAKTYTDGNFVMQSLHITQRAR